MESARLQTVFNEFASKGATPTMGAPSAHLFTMKKSKFIELAIKAGLTKEFNIKESDLIDSFDEAKFKTDEQILFSQFQDALQLIARLVFPDHEYNASLLLLEQAIIQHDVHANSELGNKRSYQLSSGNLNADIDKVPRVIATASGPKSKTRVRTNSKTLTKQKA